MSRSHCRESSWHSNWVRDALKLKKKKTGLWPRSERNPQDGSLTSAVTLWLSGDPAASRLASKHADHQRCSDSSKAPPGSDNGRRPVSLLLIDWLPACAIDGRIGGAWRLRSDDRSFAVVRWFVPLLAGTMKVRTDDKFNAGTDPNCASPILRLLLSALSIERRAKIPASFGLPPSSFFL